MKWSYLLAILIFALVYGSLNFYRTASLGVLQDWVPSSLGWVYWLIFWFVALSYIIGRIGVVILPCRFTTFLTVGSYWLACMYYLVIILLLVDLTPSWITGWVFFLTP